MVDNRFRPPNSKVVDVPAVAQSSGRGYGYIAFLSFFALLNAYLAFTPYSNIWGLLLAVLSLASAGLLWHRSSKARYPLYALTLLMGSAIPVGLYNYIHNPALLHQSVETQVISWLIPVVPLVLLIACCLYARRISAV
jgi:hypothetical protein